MKIRPLNDKILFKFVDTVKKGFFKEQHASGIVIDLGGNHQDSSRLCRLVEVVDVGPKVKEVDRGDLVVVQALMWTNSFRTGGGSQIWMTEQKHIMGRFE